MSIKYYLLTIGRVVKKNLNMDASLLRYSFWLSITAHVSIIALMIWRFSGSDSKISLVQQIPFHSNSILLKFKKPKIY